MRLISDAKHSWKFASNIVFAIIAVLAGIKEQWEEVFSAVLPDEWFAPIVAVLAILGIIVRHIDQGTPK